MIYPLTITLLASTLALAACGPSTQGRGTALVPWSAAPAGGGTHGKSWMLPEAKSKNLIYLVAGSSVLVYSYAGKRVGDLEPFNSPGLCSDPQGDVWITNEDQISEYAHGGTTPIAELTPPPPFQAISCAVDPTTNDLAVTLDHSGYPNEVAVYQNASGAPQTYTDSEGAAFTYCAYDNAGNLYVDGRNGSTASLAELPSGGSSLSTLTLSGKLAGPGGVQWEGQYLAVGDDHNNVVYQVSIASGYGTIENTIHFSSWRRRENYQFWIHDGVIGFIFSRHHFGFWNYPKGGGTARRIAFPYGTTGGNALSLAP